MKLTDVMSSIFVTGLSVVIGSLIVLDSVKYYKRLEYENPISYQFKCHMTPDYTFECLANPVFKVFNQTDDDKNKNNNVNQNKLFVDFIKQGTYTP